MHDRTLSYLRGRFGDHYRRTTIDPPPAANRREWGYVVWTASGGETYVRHNSLLDLGAIEQFLPRERPRHVYFSAGRYDDPGATRMDAKGWRSADLIFDLDADHLPGTDEGDGYAEMLAACKDALERLLDFLERDFAFEELSIVFSGSRGYHVHVRDEGVNSLDSDARREIVDYVRGAGFSLDAHVREETVAGSAGRTSPATNRYLPTDGGWGRRIHAALTSLLAEVAELEEDAAIDRLTRYDGVGEKKARTAHRFAKDRFVEIERGNLSAHAVFETLARELADEVLERDDAPIDEPVTTDTNRLIRLPGSLHGGSGLAVTPIDRDELSAFDPLVDAVPETFRGHEIAVEVTEGGPVELGGEHRTLSPGRQTVPEYLGIFLMCRGRAKKARE